MNTCAGTRSLNLPGLGAPLGITLYGLSFLFVRLRQQAGHYPAKSERG
ncbi:uncharacterized protein CTRU02_205943 [Colletotrichum truncatum]|uniref:Uncharacterized protein n=1 Tax=Colletotrichum truncatum TaxID=5467 RepID=A0ACC3Z5G7_COLTU|nr:uncharacterized protein CTRU02_04775 [Colletotrichum truncatum]KAF6795212.1 hypothetical protein CTRU02_04775 [Colletotrichum truncatum]